MIVIRTTENFNTDLLEAQEFVRAWAYGNGLGSDESEAKLQNELEPELLAK